MFGNSRVEFNIATIYMVLFLFMNSFSWSNLITIKRKNNFIPKENISNLLDELLEGYDNHLRPDFQGPPTEVFIDLDIRSMGPISEIDMTYSIDCYFRQTWTDLRLSYSNPLINITNGCISCSPSISALALSISMLDKIWKPDTVIYNGKSSYIHGITVPNKFVRIYTDGRVLYSSRMTIKASCPMNLESYPMDTQRCPLELGSFAYSTRDVVYRWNLKRSVEIASDMKMSQFDLIASPSGNDTFMRHAPYSQLIVSFHFQRHMGSFLIEVYVPAIMLVVLSWVSFWINREATADRIALGITTVLTMTFLGLESRNDLPKVPYCTALDYFVAICFAFIFATIAEFAVVHHFTKVGSGEFYFSPTSFMGLNEAQNNGDQEESSDDNDEKESKQSGDENQDDHVHGSVYRISSTPGSSTFIKGMGSTTGFEPIKHMHQLERTRSQRIRPYIVTKPPSPDESDDDYEDIKEDEINEMETSAKTFQMINEANDQDLNMRRWARESYDGKRPSLKMSTRLSSLRASIRGGLRRTLSSLKKAKRESVPFQLNSVSQIDRVSRLLFPIVFIVINFIYWSTYIR